MECIYTNTKQESINKDSLSLSSMMMWIVGITNTLLSVEARKDLPAKLAPTRVREKFSDLSSAIPSGGI